MFDAGSGVERDVRLLGEAMDRTVGVAQDGNGCMIPHLSGSQQVQTGCRSPPHVYRTSVCVCVCSFAGADV